MADGTHISWTNATWNPITGCTVLSPGCSNCYSMRLAGTRLKHHPSRAGLTTMTKAGPVWNGKMRFNEDWLDQPLRWRKPRMIFVCAHSDLFHENVPDEWIDKVVAVMLLAPQHTYQVLTKRPARMRDVMERMRRALRLTQAILAEGHERWAWDGPSLIEEWPHLAGAVAHPSFDIQALDCWPLKNVWLGVSVEDQTHAEERRDALSDLAEQGWLTWVSYEPALGPVDWFGWEFIRWLVSGGESAQNKPGRPTHPDWHRYARDWCLTNGIAYHFKQWGDWAPGECCNFSQLRTEKTADWLGDRWFFDRITSTQAIGLHRDDAPDLYRVGKKRAGRLLDGREWNEMPAVAQPSGDEMPGSRR